MAGRRSMTRKQEIANKLAEALKLTEACRDMVGITISDDEEYAFVVFKNGYSRKVCIAADSGIALIRDICSRL